MAAAAVRVRVRVRITPRTSDASPWRIISRALREIVKSGIVMRTNRRRATFLLLTVCAVISATVLAQNDLVSRARALHKQSPLIDGHNDYPWALRDLDPGRDFAKADITGSVPKLMTDIPRLKQGGLGGQFWSVYVPSTMQGKEAVRATLEQIDIVHRMTRRWPETFVLSCTAADVERAFKSRQDRFDDRHGGRPLDRQLARDPADAVRASAPAT